MSGIPSLAHVLVQEAVAAITTRLAPRAPDKTDKATYKR